MQNDTIKLPQTCFIIRSRLRTQLTHISSWNDCQCACAICVKREFEIGYEFETMNYKRILNRAPDSLFTLWRFLLEKKVNHKHRTFFTSFSSYRLYLSFYDCPTSSVFLFPFWNFQPFQNYDAVWVINYELHQFRWCSKADEEIVEKRKRFEFERSGQ